MFCNFTKNGLIPIWNFCDDVTRKDELETAANPYTDRTTNRVYYRLNYDLNKNSGGAYIYIYYLPGMENDTIVPLAEVATINTFDGESLSKLPEGFEYINYNLNYFTIGDYIYLAYRRRDTITDALVTGLRVNSAYGLGTTSSNQWNVVTEGYYSAIPQDLNEGTVFGSTIYLYYTDDFIDESALPK